MSRLSFAPRGHRLDERIELDPGMEFELRSHIGALFRNGIRKILFGAVPEISETHSVYTAARKGIYPCFPPYGPAPLVRLVEAEGYEADIIDLHFEILRHMRKSSASCLSTAPEIGQA